METDTETKPALVLVTSNDEPRAPEPRYKAGVGTDGLSELFPLAPFIHRNDEGDIVDLWRPPALTNYEQDCATGRSWAEHFIEFCRASGLGIPLFVNVMSAMRNHPHRGGYEAGFTTVVATQLLRW